MSGPDDEAASRDEVESGRPGRRPVLKALGAAGLLSLGAGRAAADPQGRVGSRESPATVVHTERLGGGVTGDTVVADLVGTGLTTETVDGAATLSAAPAANDHVGIVGDFGLDVENVDRFELAGALSAEDQGDGVVTLDADDDVLRPAWEDTDGDSLLEPRASGVEGVSGIDRITVADSFELTTTGGGGRYTSRLRQSAVEAAILQLSAADQLGGGSRVRMSDGSLSLEVSPPEGVFTSLGLSSGTVSVDGNRIDEVGGTDAAATGSIRLANDSPVNWRDSGDTADGGITLNASDELVVQTPAEGTDPIKMSVPNSGLTAGNFSANRLAFTADDAGNSELKAYVNDGTASGGVTLATYSTERMKTNVESFAGDPGEVLDIEARTFTLGNGDGEDRLGITAESAHDAGLSWLVDYVPVESAWGPDDSVDEAYVDEYGIERDGETLVPNDIHERAWLAMHHELLRDLAKEREDRDDRIAELEAEVDTKDDRIADLEAETERLREENERLRERLAAVEQHLGLHDANDSSQGTVADD